MRKRHLCLSVPFLTLLLSRTTLLPAVFQVSIRLSPFNIPFPFWSTSSGLVCWILHKDLCMHSLKGFGALLVACYKFTSFLNIFSVELLAMAPGVGPHMPCSYAKF